MTTATTSTSPTAALVEAEAELEAAVEAHQAAADAFTRAAAKVPAYEAERLAEFAQRAEALQRVLECRGRVEHLRRVALPDRLAEIDLTDAENAIRQAFEQLAAACGEYRARVERARAICAETRPLNGQAFDADERPAEWAKLAREALDSAFAPAALNAWGAGKLAAALLKDQERAEQERGS